MPGSQVASPSVELVSAVEAVFAGFVRDAGADRDRQTASGSVPQPTEPASRPADARLAQAAEDAVDESSRRSLDDMLAAGPGPVLAGTIAGLEPADLDDADLLDGAAACERLISWVAARQADLVAELARRAPGTRVDFVGDEVGARLSMSRRSAGMLVERATSLAVLPELHDALTRGDLDTRRVDALIGETRHLPAGRAREVVADLLPRAGTMTVPQVRAAARRVEALRDPAALEARHTQARAERCVTMTPAHDAMAWVNAYMPATDAITLMTALDALAATSAPEDDRTLAARRCDALADVARDILDTGVGPDGPLPTRHRRHPHLALTISAGTLPGLIDGVASGPDTPPTGNPGGAPDAPATSAPPRPGPVGGGTAILDGYGPIPASLVREVAAQAQWRAVGVDPRTGEACAQSSRSYRPSADLAARIIARDVTCTFPGCRTRAVVCDIDHIDPFDRDRPAEDQTTEHNLHALCRHHHRMKTHGRWTPRRDPDTGITTWRSRTGHTYTRDPLPTDPDAQPPPVRPLTT